mmetsp:Transcript_4050/g.9687  ORF Transcript_4050/g.9687 Transcript_4050/m.9687 type:complete len:363 (+) Transcript_4050:548-1636(+)
MLHWVGALPSLEELAELYGADDCQYAEDAADVLRASGAAMVHTLPGRVGPAAQKALDEMGVRPTEALLKGVIDRCRETKTASEVACLHVANEVTSEAHEAAMRAAPAAEFEYHIESEFLSATDECGLAHVRYPPIVGAGRNAAVLELGWNDGPVEYDDVVIMVAGAEFRYYTAYVSRTFPGEHGFSADMADVYDAVLSVQEHALAGIRPGEAWQDITLASRRLLAERLRDLGLVLGDPEAVMEAEVDKLFMPHGLGHFLGLDMHDVGDGGAVVPDVLKPGHVVTCGAGIYFVESLLAPALADKRKAGMINFDRVKEMIPKGGARIEDNVVIASDGCLNLTSAPKARRDVEVMVQSYKYPWVF